jgi:ketosteroid isomerase-like protein
MEERADAARTYYRAIDAGEYDRLERVLASGFVHDRPDRTLSGVDRFVRFMREERPMTDTVHAVDALYHGGSGEERRRDGGEADDWEVAVRGRLRRDDEDLFGFVDVFAFEGAEIALLRTYTR